MELELGQDVAEVWKVLILNQRWISSSNSAIFEKNPYILYTGNTDQWLEYHIIYSWALERQPKIKNAFLYQHKNLTFQNFKHQWKICHYIHALLSCDMMWLSGACAVSQWYTKWVMVSAQKTQARTMNKYLDFQSAAETLVQAPV